MFKSLRHASVAIVAAVGIAITPATGLAIAQPADDTVVTTPLPPPAEVSPPETEAPPPEPPAQMPPPAAQPAELPPANPPPVESPVEEVPPPAGASPEDLTPPPAEEAVPETSAGVPPADETPASPPVSESTEEAPSPPATDQPSAETEETALPSEGQEESRSESPSTEAPSSDSSAVEVPATTSTAEPPDGQRSVDQTGPVQSPAEQEAVTSAGEAEPAVAKLPEPPSVDQADVQQAFAREPLIERPQPIPPAETDKVYEQIKASLADRERDGHGDRDDRDHRDHDRWDGKVRPWANDWIRYDDPRHRGPVFCNPYHDRDIKIFYVYQGHQYVRVIPPRHSIFVDVDVNVHGMQSFTAVHVKAGNVVVDVNVGTFHHPAYVPPVHQNVQVKVVVNNTYYPRPFTVKKVVDCGYDQVRRKTRVVFDNTYVAWGNWQGHGKDRYFALEESATYPGMYGRSAEVVAAPPEPYIPAAQPRHAASETNLTSSEGLWIGGGALALALAVGLLARALIRRNGTPPQHL